MGKIHMSKRISVTVSEACSNSLEKLSELEHRSVSNTAAAILERSFPELRQEWQTTGAVKSLRKKNSRRYDAEIENMPLNAA